MKTNSLLLTIILFIVSVNSSYSSEAFINDLEEIINSKNEVNINYFEKHLDKYSYDNWHNEGEFHSFISFTNNEILPEMQMILIFYNNILYATVAGSVITSNNIVRKEQISGYNISIFNKNKKTYSKFMETYQQHIEGGG